MANGYMIKCSTSLIIRETQIRRTVRHQLMQVRMAVIRYSTNKRCCRGCGERENRSTLHWCSHYGEQCEGPLETKSRITI